MSVCNGLANIPYFLRPLAITCVSSVLPEPDYPSTLINKNSDIITKLSQVKNFLYLIIPSQFASKQDFINAVVATNYDLIIMDCFFKMPGSMVFILILLMRLSILRTSIEFCSRRINTMFRFYNPHFMHYFIPLQQNSSGVFPLTLNTNWFNL